MRARILVIGTRRSIRSLVGPCKSALAAGAAVGAGCGAGWGAGAGAGACSAI